MSVLPSDADGYAIPAADLLCDALNECELLDPDWADPLDWPDWTDEIRLDLGDGSPVNDHALEAVLYEPTEQDLADDRAWRLEVDRRNQDLEDAYRESQYLDMLEGIARFNDNDLMAAGLPVG